MLMLPEGRGPTLRRLTDQAALCLLAAVGILALYVLYYSHQQPRQPVSEYKIVTASEDDGTPQKLANGKTTSEWPVSTPFHDYRIPVVSNGMAPVLSRIPTHEPVVFLGIDDGANKQPFELALMQQNNVVASLFLAERFIWDNPSFFLDFVKSGSLVEDHTVDHKLLSQLSYAQQKQEICDEADLQLKQFGRRPIFLRPPGGDYNTDTQRAAAACGMKAVVQWIAKANGGSMQYQYGHSLQPGDIVLMHFRPEFKADMQAFLDAEKAAGLHTELLEDWLN